MVERYNHPSWPHVAFQPNMKFKKWQVCCFNQNTSEFIKFVSKENIERTATRTWVTNSNRMFKKRCIIDIYTSCTDTSLIFQNIERGYFTSYLNQNHSKFFIWTIGVPKTRFFGLGPLSLPLLCKYIVIAHLSAYNNLRNDPRWLNAIN